MTSPEHPSPSPDEMFEQNVNIALDAASALRHTLSRLANDHRARTWPEAEDMGRIADELLRLNEFLDN